MTTFTQGRYLTNGGPCSLYILDEAVSASGVAYLLQMGGPGSGKQGFLRLTDADLVSLLQRTIKAREAAAEAAVLRTKAVKAAEELERAKATRDRIRTRMAAFREVRHE